MNIEIVSETDKRTKHREKIVVCRCHCGKLFETIKRQIKKIRSCGCSRIKQKSGKFGRLTVLYRTNRQGKNASYYWKCKCDCGEETEVITSQLGKTQSCGCLHKEELIKGAKRRSGKNHYKYNHSLSEEERLYGRVRNSVQLREFTSAVFTRDDYTCRICMKRGGNLNAHHMDGYHWCIERRGDPTNGITLCEDCHYNFHMTHGWKNNTEKQFIDYMDTLCQKRIAYTTAPA